MRVVCSYCRKHLRTIPGEGYGVSHGMCAECDGYFERLWGGMKLSEYLDEIPHPVVLVNEEGRVVAANREAAALAGGAAREPRGLLGGEALACKYSRLPEGCGRSEHCRECAIRQTVEEVARTGRAARDVNAYLDTSAGRAALRVHVEPDRGFFRITIHAA